MKFVPLYVDKIKDFTLKHACEENTSSSYIMKRTYSVTAQILDFILRKAFS